jgi:ADP-ribose pyrophosphatase
MKLYQGNYITLYKENGWEYVRRDSCTGIVVMIGLTSDNKVILVEQYRIPLNAMVLEFPAGLVNDPGTIGIESLEQAARREMIEETGYEAGSVELVTEGPPSPGLSSEVISVFRMSQLKKIEAGGGVDGEHITVHEILLDEVDTWLDLQRKKGILIDPKIYMGLYFLNR